jgi:dolichyl-phosphate-mannose-protein mannosyltransferase
MPETLAAEREMSPETAAASANAPFLSSIWFVVLAAFLLRVFLCLLSHRLDSVHPVRAFVGGEADYVAWSLHSGKGFSSPFPGYARPTAWLAPVFPALWSIAFAFFNPFRTQGHVYFCQVLNSVFAALTCVPIYKMGIRLLGERPAIVSGWCWALLPLAILFPLEWAWDQSLAALLFAWLLSTTYLLSEDRARNWIWAGYGLLWGVAALTNPSLCVMLPFWLGWMAVVRWRRGLPVVAPALTAVLICLLTLAPWTVRNYRLFGHFVFVKSNFGAELWLGNNPQVKDGFTGWLHPMVNAAELQQLNELGEYAYMQRKQREGVDFIRGNPELFAKHAALRVLDTWAGTYYFKEDPWIRSLGLGTIAVACTLVFSLAAGVGLLRVARRNWIEFLPLILCVIVFPIPYYITHSSLRYRHPMDPVLTLLAVAGYWGWRTSPGGSLRRCQEHESSRRRRAAQRRVEISY